MPVNWIFLVYWWLKQKIMFVLNITASNRPKLYWSPFLSRNHDILNLMTLSLMTWSFVMPESGSALSVQLYGQSWNSARLHLYSPWWLLKHQNIFIPVDKETFLSLSKPTPPRRFPKPPYQEETKVMLKSPMSCSRALPLCDLNRISAHTNQQLNILTPLLPITIIFKMYLNWELNWLSGCTTEDIWFSPVQSLSSV